ncbi:MAG TPA: hypothetical protein VJU83_00035, partial [Burkholderiales bacterium]|nr:hypothetical protein [Burkholderiales bacterium]
KTPFISGGTLYNLSGRPNALHSIAHMHDWIDRRSTLTWALAKLRLRPWTADEKIPLPAAEECGRDSFLDLKGTETSALPLYAQRQLFYWRHAEQFFGSPRTAELSAQERAAAMSV